MTTAASAPSAPRRRQHDRAIDAIRASIRDRGFPPTLRELGDALGITAGSVHPLLRELEDLGRIRRDRNSPRAVEIVDDGHVDVLGVPLPATTDLRAQIGLVQRLAESLLTAGQALRGRQLHVAAAELEYAAQSLLAGADRQLDVMRDQKAARQRMETGR